MPNPAIAATVASPRALALIGQLRGIGRYDFRLCRQRGLPLTFTPCTELAELAVEYGQTALYLCAWSAIQHDAEMRNFYRRLRERGKPGNVSVVAVMRKLLVHLNAVARRWTPWAPQAG